jgi:RNA polymerase sigma-32 factor
MTSALALTGSVDSYLAAVRRYPLLSAEEEYRLALRWHDFRDPAAGRGLVLANLRFVIKIALEYRHYRAAVEDLVQEGNIGLMRALERFDPRRGFRFISYAVYWIRAQIQDYILRTWRVVRIGTTQLHRKLFARLLSSNRRVKDRLADMDGPGAAEAGGPEAVADMEQRMFSSDSSLDEPVTDSGRMTRMELLPGPGPTPEAAAVRTEATTLLGDRLARALAALPERDRQVVTERFLSDNPPTLDDLGARLGVSKERVRQLEARALAALRRELADIGDLTVAAA